MWFFFLSWTDNLCLFKGLSWIKSFSYKLHLKDILSLWTIEMCWFKAKFWLNSDLQISHTNWFFSTSVEFDLEYVLLKKIPLHYFSNNAKYVGQFSHQIWNHLLYFFLSAIEEQDLKLHMYTILFPTGVNCLNSQKFFSLFSLHLNKVLYIFSLSMIRHFQSW